jgi:type I restriction enzyme S subunit
MGVKNIHYGDILIKFNIGIDENTTEIPTIKQDINLSNISDKYYLQNGDIIIADTAEDYSVGKACEIVNVRSKILSGLHTIPCRPKFKFINGYLGYYINSPKYHNTLIPLITGIKVSSINKKEIKKTIIKFPSLPEQEKISSFLTLIDRKIEKQKELVELLKKYKRGLLFSLFSQKLRFKDEKGRDYPNWKEKRLEEILKIKHGKSQKEIECKNGKYPILATGGEIGKTNKYLWDKPCVLIGRKGTIDKPQYLDTPFWTVDTLFYSEVFKDNNAKYLYYLFNTINWKKYDESTGVPSLSAKTIERIKVTLSINYSEQLTISKILSNFNYKIQQEEYALNNLIKYKNGLFQQLFI